MNGMDLISNMVDELQRAAELLKFDDDETSAENELIEDIRLDLERYFDNDEKINEELMGIEIE